MRTSESYIVQGSATKKDLKGGLGALIGPVAGGFGGYEDTDQSKMIAHAFASAYETLVNELGGFGLHETGADHAGFYVHTTVNLRGGPTTKAPSLATFYEETAVIQTGAESGEWVEVEAIGKTGWVMKQYITR